MAVAGGIWTFYKAELASEHFEPLASGGVVTWNKAARPKWFRHVEQK